MTIREIFSGLIDYDLYNLNPIFQVVGGVLIYIVAPIGMLWLGRMMLVDGFAKEQPHDRDLFGRVFLILSGFVSIGIALFILWDLITLFF